MNDVRERLGELLAEKARRTIWEPLEGPQRMAYESKADVIGYGGAAGGGKTDLAMGKALMHGYEVMFMRREATQLQGVLDRLSNLLGGRDGYNGQDRVWRNAGPRDVQIEFGSVPNLGDETRYQGRPHDILIFDEAANFLESQVRFLMGWNRTTRPGVKSQALLTFNPPTNAEGRWIVEFFAPWIDKKHELYPTPPGDIRYVVTVPAENETFKYVWLDDGRPCVIESGEVKHDFDPADYAPEDVIVPQSRTFIPSRISDNPHLMGTGYLRQLQAMPEPLRSQLLYGDFQAGMTDDPWQVIPTAWVEIAQARWKERSPRGEMLSVGVDVARGGKDNTVVVTRHKTPETDFWFDKPHVHPGTETPNGNLVAGLVIAERRDYAPIHIDVIGVGAAPYDILNGAGQEVYGINVAQAASSMDKSGRLGFFNLRSQLWWKMREALDPGADNGIALPPDPRLTRELCAPKWSMSGMTIKVEGREDIIKRIGVSPDLATGFVLALIETPKIRMLDRSAGTEAVLNYDPMASLRRPGG
jgi:hypothetical protein